MLQILQCWTLFPLALFRKNQLECGNQKEIYLPSGLIEHISDEMLYQVASFNNLEEKNLFAGFSMVKSIGIHLAYSSIWIHQILDKTYF